MKRLVILIVFSLTTAVFAGQAKAASSAAWLTDFPAAQAKAKAESKLMLVNFTGSDWCGWCIKLKAEVFSKPEFEAYARDTLILVEVDFPRRKPQSAALRKANRALAEKYQIEGYPTIIMLNGDAKKVAQLGYAPGGPAPFLASIEKLPGAKPRNSVAKITPSASSGDEPPQPFPGIPLAPPPKYDELVLKGISGSGNARFALINNQTLAAGESGTVRLSSGAVKVRCVEIRPESVLVSIGESKEAQEIHLREAK
jgi:protein disulfide-isomerase